MDARPTNTRASLAHAHQPKTDWAKMTNADRVRHLEIEGYVVIPDMLTPAQVDTIGKQLEDLPLTAVDYSPNQRTCKDVQWSAARAAIDVIALPRMIEFLSALFGDDLICTSCMYSLSAPGHPGIAVHTDSQPYGSKIFGVGASAPVLVRCLYYLDDQTPERSPLKVIPRSHLSLHRDGNPYNRMLRHPDEAMVTCKAGSVALINQKIFHGNYPNYSNANRRLLAIAYRPAWAGPIADVTDWPADKLATLPPAVRPYFKSLNTRYINYDVANRPDNMAEDAPGISPRRWGTPAPV